MAKTAAVPLRAGDDLFLGEGYEAPLAWFSRILEADRERSDPKLPIGYVHADVRMGKTCLRRRMEQCCRGAKVPFATCDVGDLRQMRPDADEVDALQALCRSFLEQGVSLPRTLAHTLYLRGEQPPSQDLLDTLFEAIKEGKDLLAAGGLTALLTLGLKTGTPWLVALGPALFIARSALKTLLDRTARELNQLYRQRADREEVRAALVHTFVEELREAQGRRRAGHAVRRVLFLEHYELLSATGQDAWVRDYVASLADTRETPPRDDSLVVVFANREPFAPDDFPRQVVPWTLTGLEHPAARDYLGEYVRERFRAENHRLRRVPPTGDLTPALRDRFLERIAFDRARTPLEGHRFHPQFLELIGGVLYARWQANGHRFEGLDVGALPLYEQHTSVREALRDFLDHHTGFREAERQAVRRLALSERFDERYARALCARFPVDGREARWEEISRWEFLVRRSSEGRGLWEVDPLLRGALDRQGEETRLEVHAWSFEYWLQRLVDEEASASASAAAPAGQKDRHYRYENPAYWDGWKQAFLSLQRLLQSDLDVGLPDAFCALTLVLLEFHWWYCQNVPSVFWDRMLEMIDRTLSRYADTGGAREGSRMVDAMRRLDRAFPKEWYYAIAEWDDVPESLRQPRASWSYDDALAALEELARMADGWRARGGESGPRHDRLRGYVTAYQGACRLELAREDPRPEAVAATHAAFDRVEALFDPAAEEDRLPLVWNRMQRGDLIAFAGEPERGRAEIVRMFRDLLSGHGDEGADREACSDACKTLATIAIDGVAARIGAGEPEDGDGVTAVAREAGRMLAASLLYALWFFTADRGDYEARYGSYTRRLVRGEMARLAEASPRAASVAADECARWVGSRAEGPDAEDPFPLPFPPERQTAAERDASAEHILRAYGARFAALASLWEGEERADADP